MAGLGTMYHATIAFVMAVCYIRLDIKDNIPSIEQSQNDISNRTFEISQYTNITLEPNCNLGYIYIYRCVCVYPAKRKWMVKFITSTVRV